MKSLFKTSHKRTVFLALLATVTFVGAAILIFDVDKSVMLEFFIVSVVGLVIIILAALAFTGLRLLIKRLMND